MLVTWEGVNNNKTECSETRKGRTIKVACSIYPKAAKWGQIKISTQWQKNG